MSYTSAGTSTSHHSAGQASSGNVDSGPFPKTTTGRGQSDIRKHMESTGSTLNGLQSLESDIKGIDKVLVTGKSVQKAVPRDRQASSQGV